MMHYLALIYTYTNKPWIIESHSGMDIAVDDEDPASSIHIVLSCFLENFHIAILTPLRRFRVDTMTCRYIHHARVQNKRHRRVGLSSRVSDIGLNIS